MIAIKSIARLLTYAICIIGMAPLYQWLTTIPQLLFIICVVAGVWHDRRGVWPLKPWLQNSLIVPIFLYYALQVTITNVVQPVISVLTIMLAVRIAGEKTVRHSLQIYALSLFCLAASSLYSLSSSFLVFLSLIIILLTTALVLLTFQQQRADLTVSRNDLKIIITASLLITLLAIPLLVLFFPILPRTQLPLWSFLTPAATHSTGYSDTVEPGSQSSVTPVASLAFRAEMPRSDQSRIYWRCTVFNRTDGVKWSRTSDIPSEQLVQGQKKFTHTIYPEPAGIRPLIGLDRPLAISVSRVQQSPDGVFQLPGAQSKRINYQVVSLRADIVQIRPLSNKQFYLQIPTDIPQRIRNLGRQIAAHNSSDAEKLHALESFFLANNFRYSTKGLPTGSHPLEQFIFDKRVGHCEFFASSFALLLRAAGVPCRLVGGYLGGEYNTLGGYYSVTDDKAHVWVEVYLDGQGWQRVDPSTFAVNSDSVLLSGSPSSYLRQMAMFVDSVNHAWNRSVVTYDFEQQMTMAVQLSSHLHDIRTGLPRAGLNAVIAILLFIFICISLWLLCLRGSLFVSREQRIFNKFVAQLHRTFGVTVPNSGRGLFEIAAYLDQEAVSRFVTCYCGALYRDRPLTNAEFQELLQALEEIKCGLPKNS